MDGLIDIKITNDMMIPDKQEATGVGHRDHMTPVLFHLH